MGIGALPGGETLAGSMKSVALTGERLGKFRGMKLECRVRYFCELGHVEKDRKFGVEVATRSRECAKFWGLCWGLLGKLHSGLKKKLKFSYLISNNVICSKSFKIFSVFFFVFRIVIRS